MAFLAPLWLLALLPWTALAAWVLVGRRQRQPVPFLALWNAPEELRRPKKGFEPPPLSLVLALLASLLALLAFARPILTGSVSRPQRTFTVIVDRGASMSALGASGQARFNEAARALSQALSQRTEAITLDVTTVPTSEPWRGSPGNFPDAATRYFRTAADTDDQLRAAIAAAAATNGGNTILVLSDRDLDASRENVIRIRPDSRVENAGITTLAHRPGQAMIAVTSTHATTRILTLRSGDRVLRHSVELPANSSRNVFLDFQPATETMEAHLEGSDSFDGDDRAYLVRGRRWPAIEPRSPLPDELRRVVDVYRRHRPADESSPRVAVGRSADLKADEASVRLATTDSPETPQPELRPRPHPITSGVDWTGLAKSASLTASGPPDGWTILARSGDRPILAAREDNPATRRAWVGFESREFARTPGYVVFWTNVFDWLAGAGGDADFTARPLAEPVHNARRLLPQSLPGNTDPRHWPGTFETPTGKLALNAPPVSLPGTTGGDWAARIANVPPATPSGTPLASWLALAATACLALAAATWEPHRRRPAPIRVA